MIASELTTQIIGGSIVAAIATLFGLVGVVVGVRLNNQGAAENSETSFRREADARRLANMERKHDEILEQVGGLREQVAGIDAVLRYVLPQPDLPRRTAGGGG